MLPDGVTNRRAVESIGVTPYPLTRSLTLVASLDSRPIGTAALLACQVGRLPPRRFRFHFSREFGSKAKADDLTPSAFWITFLFGHWASMSTCRPAFNLDAPDLVFLSSFPIKYIINIDLDAAPSLVSPKASSPLRWSSVDESRNTKRKPPDSDGGCRL